jgi:hypothetical protein
MKSAPGKPDAAANSGGNHFGFSTPLFEGYAFWPPRHHWKFESAI